MALVDGGSITLMMTKVGAFDEAKIGEITKKRKSEIKTSSKLETLPF